MNTAEVRQTFLKFFEERGHEIVPSSSLVPLQDPTLLFTNAGMVQFKEVFLGKDPRPYRRAATSQKCVRAGGKHNDLDNVGYTARHHTFFEMLGNFSFGDYFKREAIHYAWELITQVFKLPPERLWITVFQDDTEAENIWLNEIGVDPARFSRCGEKDNFWAMGDTGPCGPCSEIFYDHGPSIAGGPPGSPEADGDRYVEIWNLVFMQYDRNAEGRLTPLPKPSVDTGMGLERMAAVMQQVHSNYDIDIFKRLIGAFADRFEISERQQASVRVVADHLRSCAFLALDGVVPSNEGRGYVLRRIMRRAIRHGHQLGIQGTFFHQLIQDLAAVMGAAYPELLQKKEMLEKIFLREEEQFDKTLEQGLKLLEEAMQPMPNGRRIPGETIFRLYDTYGFPVDLTADIARERQMELDMDGFEQAMLAQRERARKASQFKTSGADLNVQGETAFTGYSALDQKGVVVALYRDNQPVSTLEAGETGIVVLDQTPFYAESGGQVGDQGQLVHPKACFVVEDTQKQKDTFLHHGMLQTGPLKLGDSVYAKVDAARRKAIMLNHSATHLMHAALKKVLGDHVQQRGSVVDADRLRFDFSHPEPVSMDSLQAIEDQVNDQIRENSEVKKEILPKEEAMKRGACALFGEKYGDQVRVLTMGNGFSVELCGGTHVDRTGDIGFFKIIQETGVAAGIRRIEAITGVKAMQWVRQQEQLVQKIANQLKTQPTEVGSRLEQLLQSHKTLEKQLEKLKVELTRGSGTDLLEEVKEINGVKVLAAQLPMGDEKSLREAVDRFKNQLKRAVVVLGVSEENKVSLVAGVTSNCTEKIHAGELINHVALQVGGKGGGRPDMAQAGGKDPAALAAALNSVYEWVEARL